MNADARLTTLTRVGFAARGLLYLIIAYLVIVTGRAEDASGALSYLGEGGGRVLLSVMAAGLFGYGLWRLADAAFDIERHGSDRKGMVERAGAGVSGLVHVMLAWQAVRLVRGAASTGDSTREGTQSALQLPGGDALVVIAGVVLIGVGVFQLVKSIRGSFLKHLEPQIARKLWAQWSGRAGYAARGLVFLISGGFVLKAGLTEQSNQAGGTAEAIAWLSSPWDIIIAIGLLAFGLFSLIEACFRVLHDVPVEAMVRSAANTGRGR